MLLCNVFQGRTQILQDIPVQKISRWGGVPNVSTVASTTSVPNTVNITGNSQITVSAMQLGSSHCVFPQINDNPSNMNQMTQGNEFVNSTGTAGASIPQGDMLQDAQGTDFDNLTTQSESQGNILLLQNRRMDPLLSSAGVNVSWQTSGTTKSTLNPFSQIVQINQSSQTPTPTTFTYTGVSADLTTSCQTSQVY